MELRQVRYFAAVARHRHFTRAAQDLGLAQPALSQQVRNLERELGVTLIDRSGRRVRLTEAGEAFQAWAERILADVAGAEAAMAEFAGLRRGRLVVGTSPLPTLARIDLPGLLVAFHNAHPGLDVALREETTSDLVAALLAGGLDIAFGALAVEPPPGIAAEPLFAEDLVAMVAPDHRLAQRAAVRIEDLAEEPFVLAKPGSPVRGLVERAAAGSGASIRVAFEVSEPSLQRALAARGLGVAVVPRSLATEPGDAVAAVTLDGLPGRRTVALLWAAERPQTAAASAFLAFVRGYLAPASSRRRRGPTSAEQETGTAAGRACAAPDGC